MMADFGVVRRRGDREAMRMLELIVFADVTLDGFLAEPDNGLDFMVGNEELDQALCACSRP
jgi:hypothetical protein